MDTMIEISHLTKQFDIKTAVDDLNLSIPAGELFGFLGPNGAGKTTTIKILNGLLRPTHGTVSIGGYDLAHEAKSAKAITGYVPEDPFVYAKLTGREFLQFVGGLYSMSPGDIEKEIQYWTDFFSMDSFLDALTESYSHGTRQKLVMASAFMHHPRVMIIDEPMVGLDPISTKKVKDLFKEQSRQGITIFLSTHILAVAEELCDRVGIIHQGKLIASGNLEQMKHYLISGTDSSLETIFLQLTAEENHNHR